MSRSKLVGMACALAVVATLTGHPGSAVAASNARTMTIYAQVTKEQFVNNRDDRARGVGTNPFGQSAGTGTAGKSAHGNGPLPGDEGLFEFTLYRTAALQDTVGTGAIVCQYGFTKTGLCEASYTVNGSSLVALGKITALTTAPFSLSVTGGTGADLGSRGTLVISPDTSLAAPGNPHITHTVPSLLLAPEHLTFSLTQDSGSQQKQTMYSRAKEEQFIDNDDDEELGYSRNPYGMRDPQVEGARKGDGPFPGDESLFRFAVSPSAKAKATVTGIYTCEYYFDRNAYCNATYRFANGVVFADGTFNFDAKSFTLAVIGGHGAYAGATGEITSSPGPSSTQRLTISTGAPPPKQATFTSYSIATAEQFVNNADDRLRGKGNNPFGNFHDNTATTKQAKGPFPGDQAVFDFNVYASKAHTKAIGAAVFSCLYNFNKNVYCQVNYHLPTGTLVGAGAFNFAASSFTLAITGGTKAYAGRSGTMQVESVTNALQRLTVNLY